MSELKHQLMLNKKMSWVPCYIKSEADKVLDAKNKALELAKVLVKKDIEIIQNKDKEIEELKAQLDKAIAERDGNQVCIDALKQKLEDVQASMYCNVVDANMENRKLKRALWITRANRALEKIAWFKLWNSSISTMNPEDGARQEFDKWKKALGKFLAKAEEYKLERYGESLEDCVGVGLFSTSTRTERTNGLPTMAQAELSCEESYK